MTKMQKLLSIATTPGVFAGTLMLNLFGVFLFYNTWTSLRRKHIIYKNIRYHRADDPLFYWSLTALSFGVAVLSTVVGVVFTLGMIQASGSP